jgi:hypothetical protein
VHFFCGILKRVYAGHDDTREFYFLMLAPPQLSDCRQR